MDEDSLTSSVLSTLLEACNAVQNALNLLDDWGPAGTRPGQYKLDLAADAAACEVLHRAGLNVLSEESGLTTSSASGAGLAKFEAGLAKSGEVVEKDDLASMASDHTKTSTLLAILDPIDGSTNAHRGIPFYSTSICVIDDLGPLVAVVVNQATGVKYEAIRGRGARRDGVELKTSVCTLLSKAIVGISGFPTTHPGWAQFRAFGAASLEFCAVAEGTLDGYMVVGGSSLFVWDYLAGLLICEEAGGWGADILGADLVARDDSYRRPAVAGTKELLDSLIQASSLLD